MDLANKIHQKLLYRIFKKLNFRKISMLFSIAYPKILPVLFIFIIGVFPDKTLGAENYKAGDKLYVAPTTGVNIRELPDVKAPILANLTFNTVVLVMGDSLPVHPFRILVNNFDSGKLALQGHWVKVKSGKTTGYIFDGMLSRFKGLQVGNQNDDAHFALLFGKPTLKIIKKSTTVYGYKENYETEISTFPQGLTMESTFFDSCYDLVYRFSTSFNEAYWLIQRFLLDADAAQGIKIKKVKGKTVLSFYSCA